MRQPVPRRLRAVRLLSPVLFAWLAACEGANPSPGIAQSPPRGAQLPVVEQSAQAINQSRRTAITEAVARVAPAVVTLPANETGPVTDKPNAPLTLLLNAVLAPVRFVFAPSATGPPMPSAPPAVMLPPERLTDAPVKLTAPLLEMG